MMFGGSYGKYRKQQNYYQQVKKVACCVAVGGIWSGYRQVVVLTSGGDVDKAETKVFEGFGPIVDICYSFINSIQ